MNDYTYHVGWVVCLLVCGSRLGVCSFLRWSSTGGFWSVYIGRGQSGEVGGGGRRLSCVSLRHASTYHSLPYCDSEPSATARASSSQARQSARLKRLQCTEEEHPAAHFDTQIIIDKIILLGLRFPRDYTESRAHNNSTNKFELR